MKKGEKRSLKPKKKGEMGAKHRKNNKIIKKKKTNAAK